MDIRPVDTLRSEKPIQPEQPAISSPVKHVEIGLRVEQSKSNEQVGEAAPSATQPTVVTNQPVQSYATPEVKQVEAIMEQGLAELYASIPPEKQVAFRRAGEDTARKISLLLKETKIQVKKIVSLIKDWLSIIPGVNRFFLEQEAKIKADEIINLRQPPLL